MTGDWVRTPLSQLVERSIGGVWGSDPGLSELDIPVYRQTEFSDDGKLKMPADAIRSITASQLRTRTLQSGDILLQKAAGTASLPGRVVIVPKNIEVPATFSNFLQLLRPRTDICIPEFAFLLFWTMHQTGKAFQFQRGTNIKNLDLPKYLLQEILLPSIEYQRRVLDLIGVFDLQIRTLSTYVDSLRKVRESIIEQFVMSSDVGHIEVAISSIVEINPEHVKGTNPPRMIRYIDLSKVSIDKGIDLTIERIELSSAPGRARRVIRTNDVLVSTVRPYLKGFAIVDEKYNGEIASTGFCVLRPNLQIVQPPILWAVIRSERFVNYLIGKSTGSNYPAVRPADIGKFKFRLPPIEIQQKMSELLVSMDEMVSKALETLEQAQMLRTSVLENLLNCNHEIPDSYDKFLDGDL